MKTRLRTLVLASGGLVTLCCLLSGTTVAATWTSTVTLLQWVNNGCIFFQLSGVTQADPVYASPWFAIPTTVTDSSAAYAVLLSAKTTGTTIAVVTSGAAAGGACSPYVGVNAVTMQ
jgi:xanthine/uracil permease